MVYSLGRYSVILFTNLIGSQTIILILRQYNEGIPTDSRFAIHAQFQKTVDSLQTPEGLNKIRKVKELTKLAESGAWPTPFLERFLPPLPPGGHLCRTQLQCNPPSPRMVSSEPEHIHHHPRGVQTRAGARKPQGT